MKLWTTRLFSSLVITGIIASSTLLFSSANAEGCCKKKMDAGKGCPTKMAPMEGKKCEIMQGWEDAVHLSAEQKKQIDQIRLAHEPDRDKLHTQITEAKDTLRRLMEANGNNTPADENAVIAQVQAIGSLKTMAEVNHIKEAYQIKALLTPQQPVVSRDYWKNMWDKKEKMGYGRVETKPASRKLMLWNRSAKTEQSAKGCPLSLKK